ncbi:MarR family transcriptional regulator [Novosphingobium album (ex Hu et al. 2023)]|uniref:MarR family transcriptional regulator n=1 Tax=Novosphingobium album (ex Hu et al. 2023) TaxID=2930093 RepID=A0ABT0B052_9SPHN|nr:MarR family transcriptional regulator [Novosphingobium album (ex Hu et al. 2023)]MCJ2178321.1 MarR family transcriptional regulator [Novosphingobium album (ex Hu et al. 2023)]
MHDTEFHQPDFPYSSPGSGRGIGAGGLPVTLSIFADRAHLRAVMRDDAQAAGLKIATFASLADLSGGAARPLGDVVMVDCPQVDAEAFAALALLDLHAARCDVRLIVSTSVEALDDVFSCMDQSAPVLLVDPSRAERVIALGQVLAGFGQNRLRELSDDDRLMLLRLSDQVGQIAGKIERLAPDVSQVKDGGDSAFRFASQSYGSGSIADEIGALQKGRRYAARPPLPDARLVRKIIRQRQQRVRHFDPGLFADPAWDMLLDLTAARVEHKRVSVTSLCIASGVPPTTALRWIGQMVEAGLFARVCDDSDRRRAFIELTDRAADAMARYFAERE